MIVVFVVDTSPSMGQRFVSTPQTDETNSFSSKDRSAGSGMSRLDLAKMAVESLTKGLSRRVIEHNNLLQQESPNLQKSLHNMGLGFTPTDQILLLSTGRQYPHHPAVSSCGAGGRLLVGYGEYISADQSVQHQGESSLPHASNLEGFQKELKGLQATIWQPPNKNDIGSKNTPFPEDGGGAEGLNVALSAGLQLLSRYRLKSRSTENFGMGRLPSPAMMSPSGGGQAANALQPACLVLLTDGECLRKPPSEGGGTLKVQFGNMPLREFYKEPFRWDQRVFCLGVGGREGVSSTQYLHSQLRALCEVTGGCHMMLRSSASLSQVSDLLLRIISPPRPRQLPIADPLRMQPTSQSPSTRVFTTNGSFVNGGPICCFQSLETTDAEGGNRPIYRAMLLYVPHQSGQTLGAASDAVVFHPPTWCIPESYFPSKVLDSLPPRAAQPLLTFSRHSKLLGSKSFDPVALINALHKLDQLLASRAAATQGTGQSQTHANALHRDVYICEWLSLDGRAGKAPPTVRGMEYFTVLMPGAGRSLSEGDESFLNFGILHIPPIASTMAFSASSKDSRFTTLTLLPPEPQILLPLLIKAAEAELRALKKAAPEATKDTSMSMGSTAGLIQKQSGSVVRNVHLDENWRTEFRAYLFRVPPYYQNALKRTLRHILPASVHSMLSAEGIDAVASQCFSKVCLQKIRNGEQVARETTERLEFQEAELRRRGLALSESQCKPVLPPKNRWNSDSTTDSGAPVIGYGQYDPRSTTERYLAALRNMPPPWRSGAAATSKSRESSRTEIAIDALSETASVFSVADSKLPSALEVLGDLPACCLLPYYESRRRWIFGGSGLTTRGLHVEGVNNDGSNSQRRKGNWTIDDEPLLSLAGVGASTLNHTTTENMGNYRERLLWSRSPVVGYGSNETSGVAATTAPDGSPRISVDDDAMPVTFFDPKTGEFADSVQARVRSRLLVNFGNPFKEKRGDSLVPEKFRNQSPPLHQGGVGLVVDDGPMTPPGSPPHDSFSGEGEGEAVFAGKPTAWKGPARPTSPRKRDCTPTESDAPQPEPKKAKTDPTIPMSQEQLHKTQNASKPNVPAPPPPKSRNPSSSNPSRPMPPPKPPQRKPPPPPPPGSNKQPPELHEEKKVSKVPPPPPPPPKSAPKPEPKQKSSTSVDTAMKTQDAKQKQLPESHEGITVSRALPPLPPKPSTTQSKQSTESLDEVRDTKAPPHAQSPAPKQEQKQSSAPASLASTVAMTQDVKLKQNPSPVPPQQVDLQSPDVKPKVDLPAGWMCVWSKSQRRWYFFDTKTNRSVWQWPPPPT